MQLTSHPSICAGQRASEATPEPSVSGASPTDGAHDELQISPAAVAVVQGAPLLPLGESTDRLNRIPVDALSVVLEQLPLREALRLAHTSRGAQDMVAKASAEPALAQQLGLEQHLVSSLRAARASDVAPDDAAAFAVVTNLARLELQENQGLYAAHRKELELTHSRTTAQTKAKLDCLRIQEFLGSDHPAPLLRAAQLLARHGAPVEAAKALRRAIQLQPQSATLHVQLAKVCVQAGVHGGLLEEAIAAARAGVERDARVFVTAHNLIAQVHLLRQDHEAGQAELRAIDEVEAAAGHHSMAPVLTRAMMQGAQDHDGRPADEDDDMAVLWHALAQPRHRAYLGQAGVLAARVGEPDRAANLFMQADHLDELDPATSVHSPFLTQEFRDSRLGSDFLDRHYALPNQLATLQLPRGLPVRDGSGLAPADRADQLAQRVARVEAALSIQDSFAVRQVAQLLLLLGRAGEALDWLRSYQASMANDVEWNLAMAHVLLCSGPRAADEAARHASLAHTAARFWGGESKRYLDGAGAADSRNGTRMQQAATDLQQAHINESVAAKLLIRALLLKGSAQAAQEALKRLERVPDAAPWKRPLIAIAQHASGQPAQALETLQAAISNGAPINPSGMAEAFAALGDQAACFEWIDQAMHKDYQGLLHIVVAGSPFIPETIVQDSRWQDLLRELGRSKEQLDRVQFRTGLTATPAQTFNSHLAAGYWHEAAAMIRAGAFGEASGDRARMLLIACLEPMPLQLALDKERQGWGKGFTQGIEFVLSILDEGLLGEHTRRGYVTLLARLEASEEGRQRLPELTHPDRLARYELTKQHIASLPIASTFH